MYIKPVINLEYRLLNYSYYREQNILILFWASYMSSRDSGLLGYSWSFVFGILVFDCVKPSTYEINFMMPYTVLWYQNECWLGGMEIPYFKFVSIMWLTRVVRGLKQTERQHTLTVTGARNRGEKALLWAATKAEATEEFLLQNLKRKKMSPLHPKWLLGCC